MSKNERLDIQFVSVAPTSWKELRKDISHFKIHTPKDYKWTTPDPPKIYRNLILTMSMMGRKHLGGVLTYLRKLRESGYTEKMMFDSGGFQVLTNKHFMSFDRMLRFNEVMYPKNSWADCFVMPDSPPNAAEPLPEMIKKVEFTIKSTTDFFKKMPLEIQKKSLPVFHLRFADQIGWQWKAYKHIIETSGQACISLQAPSATSLNRIDYRNMTIIKELMNALPDDTRVHCLGIASPASIFTMGYFGLTSYDAVTPITNAGMGRVLFHTGGINFTDGRPGASVRIEDVIKAKEKSNHRCPFCDDLDMLYKHYRHRRIHNHIMLDEINYYYRDLNLDQFAREWPKESRFLEEVLGNGQQSFF